MKETKLKNIISILMITFLLILQVGCAPLSSQSSKENSDYSYNSSFNNYIESNTSSVAENSSSQENESFYFYIEESAKAKPSNIPNYSGTPYIIINNNEPYFSSKQLKSTYEKYSNLDSLGRCGIAIAVCGKETMPKEDEKRGSISHIKPTGWIQAKYDNISGIYLYNRCHLIGWQLSAENANRKNIITGTRYMNVQGMLPFENMVADYIKETGNRVAYRVTPIYKGDNLLANGVQMEAYSIEDKGDGICFNVYCYNVQPQITINYKTGESSPNF